jgi:hypothetical protein
MRGLPRCPATRGAGTVHNATPFRNRLTTVILSAIVDLRNGALE